MSKNVLEPSPLPRSIAAVAVIVLMASAASGCKTGTAGMRPAWWTFGGGTQDQSSQLAAAPSFNGSTEKPSATAKPYPTTTTPNGYVLNGAAPAGAAVATVEPPAAAAVTYGQPPRPTQPEPVPGAASFPTAPAAAPSGSMSSISPQVGPYAALPAEQPAATQDLPPLQPIAAAPSAFAEPAPAALAPPAAPRMADARGAAAWPAQQPAPDAVGPRYDAAVGSRYAGGSAIDQPFTTPPAAGAAPVAMPSALEPLPSGPTAAMPGSAPPAGALPAAYPPPAAPMAPPGTGMAPGGPATSPLPRRPDPAYRPGGTSSYRPNRAILTADSPASEDGDVVPASFEMPASPAP